MLLICEDCQLKAREVTEQVEESFDVAVRPDEQQRNLGISSSGASAMSTKSPFVALEVRFMI